MPKAKNRKPSKYNKVLKAFTKINNKLPEDRKLSIAERRKIIREQVLPKLSNTPYYKLRVKDINKKLIRIYNKLPPKEICDINYIDPSVYGGAINWFEIDEFIGTLPDCIYIKVSAGRFGETRIFNTRNYNYQKNGVRAITERIRPYAENKKFYPYYSGTQKLRPRKLNDGTPENYYIDFILYINDTPQDDETSTKYTLPRTKSVKRKKKRIQDVLLSKMKDLQVKKQKRKRARATLDKNKKQLSRYKKKLTTLKKPKTELKTAYLKQLNKNLALIEKYYKNGVITKEKYKEEIKKAFLQKGGIVKP